MCYFGLNQSFFRCINSKNIFSGFLAAWFYSVNPIIYKEEDNLCLGVNIGKIKLIFLINEVRKGVFLLDF